MNTQTMTIVWSSISCIVGLVFGGTIILLLMKAQAPQQGEKIKLELMELKTQLVAKRDQFSFFESAQKQMMEILMLSRMKLGTPVQPRCVAIRRRLRSLNWLVSPRRCIDFTFDEVIPCYRGWSGLSNEVHLIISIQ